MGGGESYMMAFAHWREGKQFDEATRIAYFRKYPPPARWLEWVIESIWGVQNLEQDDVTVYTPYFDRVEALGFGSKADFERDANDPKWHDD